MTEVELSFPLDADGYLRRECPFCVREFKVLIEQDELNTFIQSGLDSFLVEDTSSSDVGVLNSENDFFCPYCGQESGSGSWFTQEQNAYITVAMKNIMAQIVNREFIRPMKRKYGGKSSKPFSLHFEGKEMEQYEPWISPEENDLEIRDLPCCQRKIKIEDNWSETVFCFFCGFPH